ncbi:MAG: hypothetical protein WBD30_07755 [Bacteroidota bacterium]
MDRRQALQLLGLSGGAFLILTPHLLASARGMASDAQIQEALKTLRGEPDARAEVRVERGGPRLFVNDLEIFAVLGMSADGLLETAEGYTLSGFDYFSPIIGLNAAWESPGVYDFQPIEEYLAALLAINPRARFLPRVQLNVPQWWKDAHPDQLVQYGLPYPEEEYRMKEVFAEGGFNLRAGRDLQDVSLASALWKREMGDILLAFLGRMMASPLRSRIIGYELVHAKTSEWHYIGSRYLPDYSEIFRNFIGVAPTPEERMNPGFGLVRDPSREQAVIDFYRRYHQNTAQTILHFAHLAKEATKRQVVIGTFYTYLLENVMIQEAGHLAPEPVLRSPDIDYLASPYTYMRSNMPGKKRWESDVVDDSGNWLGRARGVGGDGGFRILLESLKRHGKLFFSECDPSTYLEPTRTTEGGSGYDTVEGSLKILERDMGNIFALGTAGWFLDFGILPEDLGASFSADRGWYDDPPMHKLFRKVLEIGKGHLRTDISSVSGIAAVYDAKSFFVTNHWTQEEPYRGFGISITDMVNHWFLNAQARALHRIGAPVDFLYRFDLRHDDADRYKLFFMINLFYLTEEEVDRLRALLRQSGATAVWYYAPGFVTPKKLDLKQMEHLTGFTFSMEISPAPMLIHCQLPDDQEPVDMQFGLKKPYYPRFSVAGPDVTVLGRWTDTGKPAFASCQQEGWTSVYVGAAPLPIQVLRWLAREAGCHIWCDRPDVIRAVRERLMVVAQDDGERVLSLPHPLAPVEGGAPSSEHRLSMKFGEIKLFSGLVS